MNIATMYDLIGMLRSLNSRVDNGNKRTVNDWVFEDDGKSVWVLLSNGEEYRFTVK